MEIRFNIELTNVEQERFDELQRVSDRTAQQWAKALLYAALNRGDSSGSVYLHSIGRVRDFVENDPS